MFPIQLMSPAYRQGRFVAHFSERQGETLEPSLRAAE
jgi:hypothetical protein